MKNYIFLIFRVAVLCFSFFSSLAYTEETHQFIPEPVVSRALQSIKEKKPDPYFQWVQSIVEKLEAAPSTDKVLQDLSVSDQLKKSLHLALTSKQLSKKLLFRNEADLFWVTSGKLKATIQLVNPVQEIFLVNDYEVKLFGKTEQEKLVYLVKVLKFTLSKPSLKSWLSLIASDAHAENQLFLIEDSELTALGVGVDAITAEVKDKACQEAQQNFQQATSDSESGFLNRARKNLSSYTSGDESLAQKDFGNPQALKVAVSFWCESQTTMARQMTNFHVKCSDKKEIDSISYAAFTPKGEATPVGFIRKTQGSYFFGTSAAKIAESTFNKSNFIKNIENCCAEKSANCETQMNQIAPIAADPTQQNSVHDRIDVRAESSR